MRTVSMFLTAGLLLFVLGAPAEGATTSNSYATATSSSAVDPTVRTNVSRATFGSTCSSVLVGKDKMPIAICTGSLSRNSTIYLFDTTGRKVLASYAIAKASSNGALPAYLDNRGWLVVVNGDRVLWRVMHSVQPGGKWALRIAQVAVLTDVLKTDDAMAGLQPDSAGHVWFATKAGVVGTADTNLNTVRAIRVKSGEQILQDLAAASTQIVATTSKAVYKLSASAAGVPKIASRTAK